MGIMSPEFLSPASRTADTKRVVNLPDSQQTLWTPGTVQQVSRSLPLQRPSYFGEYQINAVGSRL